MCDNCAKFLETVHRGPYDEQLRSPMNMALHWSEDARCWEVIVRYRGKRIGVTQVRRLDDLGQTVLDYVALASDVPMNPNAAVTESLRPKALPTNVEDYAQEIVHNFICPCPDVDGMPPHPCPNARQVAGIVERLDAAGVLRREPSTSDGD